MSNYWPSLVLLLIAKFHWTLQDCVVPMNGGLPDPQPLVLLPGGSRDVFGFKPPVPPDSVLSFAEGEVTRLVCTGPDNFFRVLSPNHWDIAVTCTDGLFQVMDNNVPQEPRPFNHFGCEKLSESTTRRTPALCNQERHRLLEIGFPVSPSEFYWIMEICFDEVNFNVIWSRFDLVPSILSGEVGNERPRFAPGPHYPGINPDNLFTRLSQRKTVGKIIGQERAEHFIPRLPQDTKVYLSRGHLTANADFTYNVLKNSTFYFINVAPQWHTFNDGSWKYLEIAVRYFANYLQLPLVVYTGTHGVTTLPDSTGVEHELFLDYKTEPVPRKRIPVPAVFWKVVYDPLNQKGIAFVGVNNPHRQFEGVDHDPRYQLCNNKINVRSWRICESYQPGKQVDGFLYCCEVDDLRQWVTSLPPFEVTGVLQ